MMETYMLQSVETNEGGLKLAKDNLKSINTKCSETQLAIGEKKKKNNMIKHQRDQINRL